jgi:hypothetical protein
MRLESALRVVLRANTRINSECEVRNTPSRARVRVCGARGLSVVSLSLDQPASSCSAAQRSAAQRGFCFGFGFSVLVSPIFLCKEKTESTKKATNLLTPLTPLFLLVLRSSRARPPPSLLSNNTCDSYARASSPHARLPPEASTARSRQQANTKYTKYFGKTNFESCFKSYGQVVVLAPGLLA